MKSSRNLYLWVPLILLVCWVGSYHAWRARGGSEKLRPLFDTSKQWYIGRDGEADATADIRRGRMKLFGGWSGDGFGRYELDSYQEILRDHYSVEPVDLYDVDSVPDKYVIPYCNAYNAVIFEHLKTVHGPDIAKRIRSEYQKEAELKQKAAEVLNQQTELNAANSKTTGQRQILPEEYLGGAENLKALTNATILTVEKVSVPPELKLKGIKDGKPEFVELPVLKWTGSPLQVDKGPVAVPASLARRIKTALNDKWVDDGLIREASYRPTFRIKLNDPGHVMEILVIDAYNSFQLYREGVRVGGRPPGQNEQEFRKIIAELEALLL